MSQKVLSTHSSLSIESAATVTQAKLNGVKAGLVGTKMRLGFQVSVWPRGACGCVHAAVPQERFLTGAMQTSFRPV